MAVSKQEVWDGVQKVFIEVLRVPIEKITPEARLAEDLEVDSLFAVQLAIALEERFKISIPEEDTPGMLTVGDMLTYIEAKVEAQ